MTGERSFPICFWIYRCRPARRLTPARVGRKPRARLRCKRTAGAAARALQQTEATAGEMA